MRSYKIIPIFSWSLVAVILIGVMIYLRQFQFGTLSTPFPRQSGAVMMNQAYDGSGLQKIELDTRSADIRFTKSDTQKVQVTCTGSKSNSVPAPVTVSNTGGTLKIQQNPGSFFFFSWNRWIQIEVKIPKNFAGDMKIQSTSGDVDFDGDYKFGEFSLSHTSGEFQSGSLTARTFTESSSSGDISIAALSAESYQMRNTSGDLEIRSLSGAGAIETTSGKISVHFMKMTNDVSVGAISGDVNLSFDGQVCAAITAQCASGDISANFPLTYGDRRRNRAAANIGTGAAKNLSVSTASGDIDMKAEAAVPEVGSGA